ncbi:hypothetical protein C7R54_06730 [Achromobacter aloeverae]|uniref:Uncharacterized protein n=1 Tax=Achromobacter aloeverae TaxID=1750518 RepID=A0A4Q1HRU4_9BURK|nr:hypothetical protein C7R54_06730 [Achromobacter aloeverae]
MVPERDVVGIDHLDQVGAGRRVGGDGPLRENRPVASTFISAIRHGVKTRRVYASLMHEDSFRALPVDLQADAIAV